MQAFIDATRALQAVEFGDHIRVVVVELDFVELLRPELYFAVLTLVRPEVARVDPPCSAISAYQLCLYNEITLVPAFISRPVATVICFQTLGAPKLCLAGLAD